MKSTKSLIHRAAAAQPPRGTPEQILGGALELGKLVTQFGVDNRGLSADQVPGLLRAGTVYLEFERSLYMTIAGAVAEPAAADIAAALGYTPGTLNTEVDQQALLWECFLPAWTIRQAARGGHQLVDAARDLARTVVRNEVQAQLAGTALSDDEKQQLIEDFKEVALLEGRQLSDVQAHRADLKGLEQTKQGAIDKVNQHRALLGTLARLQDGQEPPWAEMLAAAETLEEIEAENNPPAPPASPAPPATHGGTVAVLPVQGPASNRRGSGR